jgi:hypothetical protein
MLPNNRASTVDISSRFLSTDEKASSRTVDWERGGVAINDASQGLDVQDWKLHLSFNNLILTPSDVGEPTVVYTASGLTDIALAFDLNMRPVLAAAQAGSLWLRWYDSTVSAYRVDTFGVGASPKLALDDRRPSRSGIADVILAYIRDGALYYRQQRDRYLTERMLVDGLDSKLVLKTIGMSRQWRMQFELGSRT